MEILEDHLKKRNLKFIRHIGAGSFGNVQKVQGEIDELVSAVKCISVGKYQRTNKSELEPALWKIRREIYGTKKLNKNDHVVKIYNAWFCGPKKPECEEIFNYQITNSCRTEKFSSIGSSFLGSESSDDNINTLLMIQMEYCDSDLRKWMTSNPTREMKLIVELSCQMLDGLAYIHQQRVIHMDLKPQNIFINNGDLIERTCCKIGDFGLATFISEDVTDLLTTAVGTPQYRSPEMRDIEKSKNGKIDEKTDIFSIGLILLELAYHKQIKDFLKVAEDIRNGKPFDFQENTDFSQLLKKMLSKVPEDRPTALKCHLMLQAINNPYNQNLRNSKHVSLTQKTEENSLIGAMKPFPTMPIQNEFYSRDHRPSSSFSIFNGKNGNKQFENKVAEESIPSLQVQQQRNLNSVPLEPSSLSSKPHQEDELQNPTENVPQGKCQFQDFMSSEMLKAYIIIKKWVTTYDDKMNGIIYNPLMDSSEHFNQSHQREYEVVIQNFKNEIKYLSSVVQETAKEELEKQIKTSRLELLNTFLNRRIYS